MREEVVTGSRETPEEKRKVLRPLITPITAKAKNRGGFINTIFNFVVSVVVEELRRRLR